MARLGTPRSKDWEAKQEKMNKVFIGLTIVNSISAIVLFALLYLIRS